MQVGNLVLHKKTKKTYLIIKTDESALIGLALPNGDLGWFHKNWFEVINASR